jgi:hypothetical protein
VSPSGRNFLYFNGSHLLIFEVAAQTFDLKMTVVIIETNIRLRADELIYSHILG